MLTNIMWIITAFVTMVSCVDLMINLAQAKGAPQQAAAGAVAAAFVIIFYVLTRCCEGLDKPGKIDKGNIGNGKN